MNIGLTGSVPVGSQEAQQNAEQYLDLAAKLKAAELERDQLREALERTSHDWMHDALDKGAEINRLRAGLQWYADGEHYTLDEWDEEEGWLCPPNFRSWMVEPGHVARAILAGQEMNPNSDADDRITREVSAVDARDDAAQHDPRMT